MLTEQQRLAIDAATKVLQMAGISAWFEARIIKDSDKKLNGRRISSKRRTDLESVLKVAEAKRVGMLPDMRMELRMYATAASSRAVFLGQEQPPALPKGAPLRVDLPLLGVINVDNPRDPRHRQWSGATGDPAQFPGLVAGQANYSPRRNVQRLIDDGAPDHLIGKALARIPGMAANPDAPLANARTVSQHTCDAAGPMRQQDPSGPFITTCSICGEFNGTP